jgi:hypothetical protein
MGQAVSKRVVPRLNTALKDYEKAATLDGMQDMARRQAGAHQTGGYSDPNAVHGGFRRERSPGLPSEARQEDFLRGRQAQAPSEMPDDLLQFLNQNPLEKTVDRDLTSPNVYDSLVSDESGDGAEARRSPRPPRERIRRTMPLAEGMADGLSPESDPAGLGAPGVERTTNFSTAEIEEEGSAALSLEDGGLASLLRRHGATKGPTGLGAATEDPSVRAAALDNARAYLADRFPSGAGSVGGQSEAEVAAAEEEGAAFLGDALTYTGMPVLMKDTDSDFVGVWSERVGVMERQQLRLVNDDEATILLEMGAGGHSSSVTDDASSSITTEEISTSTDGESPTADAVLGHYSGGNKSDKISSDHDANQGNGTKAGNRHDNAMQEETKAKVSIGNTSAGSRAFLEQEAARLKEGAGNS